ncbi:MAG: hypothetical protein AAFX94_05625 [Myxococcota bacterium]
MLFKFAMTSMNLALNGKLVRNWPWVIRRGIAGAALGGVLFAVPAYLGAPLLVSVTVSAGVVGFVMPFMFKDMKAA